MLHWVMVKVCHQQQWVGTPLHTENVILLYNLHTDGVCDRLWRSGYVLCVYLLLL